MNDLMNMAESARRLTLAGSEINRRRFETRGNCVLNGEQVIAIRSEYRHSTYRRLGTKYGVDYTTIRRIIKRTSWDNIE